MEDRLIFVADNGALHHVYQNGKTLIRRTILQEKMATLDFSVDKWADVCLMLSNEENIYMQDGSICLLQGLIYQSSLHKWSFKNRE